VVVAYASGSYEARSVEHARTVADARGLSLISITLRCRVRNTRQFAGTVEAHLRTPGVLTVTTEWGNKDALFLDDSRRLRRA
jgi:hypothetical protein